MVRRMTTEPLLTEHEVATHLNMRVTTLRRWRWAGRGPRFLKIGGAVRYDPNDIEDYVKRARCRSTSNRSSC